MESDAIPRTLDSSISVEFSPEVTQDGDHVADGMLQMLRIMDRGWVRSKILLQLGELEEINVSPHGSLRYSCGLCSSSF